MADEVLFRKNDLSKIIARARAALIGELDGQPDEKLLNTPLSELEAYCEEKYCIDLPELGEPVVDERRIKMQVGRYGGRNFHAEGGSVTVDGYEYRLEVPYTGDKILFFTQGSSWGLNPPSGNVGTDIISKSLQLREPDAEKLNQDFEAFLENLGVWLGYLKGDIESWNSSIPALVAEHIQYRRDRADKAQAASSGLKFNLKPRAGGPSTYAAPIAPKKIKPVFPEPKPGAKPEPVLTEGAYREILDTLQQMSEVMERSPHAFASMDEETLRFQYLVPLNAKFEGEARGEAFNYSGKTDILITHKGKNIFIAELKIWSGAKALKDAIDQLLGYVSWRDTKTALVLFNRNRNFSNVLEQIEPTVAAHPNYVAPLSRSGETEFQFKLSHRDDPERHLTLTVLAFDLPSP